MGESFIFNLKSSLDNDQIKSKLSSEEISGAQSALDDALKWMDANQLEKEEFEDKQKELETMSKPIMSKIYGGQAGESCDQQQQRSTSSSNGGAGPTIEEVD